MARNGSDTESVSQSIDLSNMSPETLKALLGGGPQTTLTGVDDDIQYHESPMMKSIVVPQGMAMETVADLATRKAAEMNKVHAFQHVTEYRPNDGAFAAGVVIKRMFGLTIGKAKRTMFGENPPGYMTIAVAHNRKVEVPWGQLEIPALPGAVFEFHGTDGKHGPVFAVVVHSPKKHKPQIEEFFRQLDAELASNSIYRGQALMGAYELEFMDTSRFKANEIVFSDTVQDTLDAALFSILDYPEASVDAGLPTKRSLLAYGPYGTGKSSLGKITAQRATAAGVTFLSAKAGKDRLRPVLETAKLYQPAVVFVEDIDTHTPNAKDKNAVSEILDLFDGISSKDDRIVVVMTTNHIDRVPAGMLRPGRLDYIVEIAGLDRNGTERLFKAVVRRDLLAADVDYDEVYSHMTDWQPAWVRAVADRAQSFAIARSKGALSYGLTTKDLVGAAKSLKPQLELMDKALEGFSTPEFSDAFDAKVQESVKAAVNNIKVLDDDADQVFALSVEPRRGGRNWELREN